MIESMYKIAENNKANVVIFNIIAHWPDNHIEKLPSLCFDTINGDEATYHMYTDNVGSGALWNKLIKKELIDELNSTFKRVSGNIVRMHYF